MRALISVGSVIRPTVAILDARGHKQQNLRTIKGFDEGVANLKFRIEESGWAVMQWVNDDVYHKDRVNAGNKLG